ncbi:MAG: hypothetical protein VYA69_05990 [Gemmatimonadota bacterium]|nr:hypothetical protein [Gemmatimonadota bacterium]
MIVVSIIPEMFCTPHYLFEPKRGRAGFIVPLYFFRILEHLSQIAEAAESGFSGDWVDA